MSENTTYQKQMSFAGAFHASHSVLPGSEEARKMTVISGMKCLELYKSSSQIGLLAKTFLASSIWNSTLLYLTWKPKGTPQKRLLFQLVPSVPRIGGIGSGLSLIPTPDTMPEAPNKNANKKYPKSLLQAAQDNYYPTPTSADHWKGKLKSSQQNGTKHSMDLPSKVGGQLNPEWVEWLMGYPTGWTDLDHLETP